jgi:riboflavin synthase
VFTGLIEEVGRIAATEPSADGVRLRIAAERVLESMRPGDSVAIDGVCQTVVEHDVAGFSVQAIASTLERTTLGRLRGGDEVNLERALALGERLGGHLVQGHVDAVGEVVRVEPHETHVLVDVRVPELVREATVLHGSIAVQGVSLTVNRLRDDIVQVALIPHTWQHTNLRRLAAGDAVNLEADLIGKYVTAYMKRASPPGV